MSLQLGTALVIVALLASAALVLDREHRWAPLVALGAAVLQTLLLFDFLDVLRRIWRIEFLLPALQFICGYMMWTEARDKKRVVTSSTVLLVVTMLQMAILLGRIR
jgi:hypothetical protein